MPSGEFVLVGPDGELEPWQVRSDMVVTKTIYDHQSGVATVFVEQRAPRAQLGFVGKVWIVLRSPYYEVAKKEVLFAGPEAVCKEFVRRHHYWRQEHWPKWMHGSTECTTIPFVDSAEEAAFLLADMVDR